MQFQTPRKIMIIIRVMIIRRRCTYTSLSDAFSPDKLLRNRIYFLTHEKKKWKIDRNKERGKTEGENKSETDHSINPAQLSNTHIRRYRHIGLLLFHSFTALISSSSQDKRNRLRHILHTGICIHASFTCGRREKKKIDRLFAMFFLSFSP